MVMIGQTVLDAGRPDLGWIFSLQEDPPAQLFTPAQGSSGSVGPCSHLTDPKWLAVFELCERNGDSGCKAARDRKGASCKVSFGRRSHNGRGACKVGSGPHEEAAACEALGRKEGHCKPNRWVRKLASAPPFEREPEGPCPSFDLPNSKGLPTLPACLPEPADEPPATAHSSSDPGSLDRPACNSKMGSVTPRLHHEPLHDVRVGSCATPSAVSGEDPSAGPSSGPSAAPHLQGRCAAAPCHHERVLDASPFDGVPSFCSQFSFWSCASALPRLAFSTGTAYARFLRISICIRERGPQALDTAIFPLPIPDLQAFADKGPLLLPIMAFPPLLLGYV